MLEEFGRCEIQTGPYVSENHFCVVIIQWVEKAFNNMQVHTFSKQMYVIL
jgi:hypothetical protein